MNAEIRRYSWGELTKTRLIFAPAVIGILYASVNGESESTHITYWLNALAALCCLWGMGQCTISVGEEVISGTWDWQRLSPQDAFGLAFGKILGAPIFQWYCFLVCSIFYFLTPSPEHDPSLSTPEWFFRWVMILFLCFSFAVMGSVESARQLRSVRRPSNRMGRSILFFVFLAAGLPGAIASLSRHTTDGLPFMSEDGVNYYGHIFALPAFIDLSLFVFALWALGGCYRTMKSELLFRCVPWFWLCFLLFLTAYITPFIVRTPTPFYFSVSLFTVSLLGTYLNILREDKDVVSFRRMLESSKNAFPFHLIPCWAVSFMLLLMGLCGVEVFESAPVESIEPVKIQILAALGTLFLIRDCCLMLTLHVRNPRHSRNDFAFVFYLFCLYVIFPVCLKLTGNEGATRIFWPIRGAEDSWKSVFWATPLAALSLIFLLKSLQQIFRPQPSAPAA